MAETIRYGIEIEDKGTPKLVGLRKEFERAGAAGSKAGKQMSDGLKSAADRIPGLSSAMGAFAGGPLSAAAAGAGALAAAAGAVTFKAMNFADKINDLSIRLGVSTERLSGMSVMAEQSGTNIEDVAKAMGKLSVKLGEGDKTLKDLGITATSTDEAFYQIADKIANIEDPTKRAAVANAAFGKSWQELMPLLVMGGDELRKMSDSAPIVSKHVAEMADSVGDKWAELMGNITGVGLDMFEKVAPLFDKLLEKLNKWLAGKPKVINLSGGMAGVTDAPVQAQAKTFLEKIGVKQQQTPWIKKTSDKASKKSSDDIIQVNTVDLEGKIGGTDKEVEDMEFWAPIIAMRRKAEEEAATKRAEEAQKEYEGRLRLEYKLAEEQERIAEQAADAVAAKWNSAANSVSSAFSTAFSQTLNNGRNLFAGLADSFKQMLLQMVADMAARAATFMIFDAITGGNAGGTLGGSKGPMSFGDFVFGGGRASGGPMQGGRSYLVGERGPEWITMGSAGRATPAASQNITINVTASNGDGKSIADEVSRALRVAGRRRLAGIR